MTTFLNICLLALPWIFIPLGNITNQFRLPQAIFLDFTFLGIILFGIKNGFQGYKNKYLSYFTAYIFFVFMVYFIIPLGLDFRGQGRILALQNLWILEPFVHFILGLFAIIILLSTLTKDDYKRIAKTLCISSTLIALFAIFQFIGLDPLKSIASYSCGNKISACLDNPNLVGGYLALTTPLFFVFKERKYIICFLLTFLAIFLAKSNFAILLTLLGIIIFVLLNYRHNKNIIISIILITCILISIVFIGNFHKLNSGLDGRLACWKTSLNYFKNNTLFGIGLGRFKTLGVKIANPNAIPDIFATDIPSTMWTEAHNDWLERLVDIGISGVGLLLFIIINTFRNFKLTDKQSYAYLSMFIVFLVMMLGSFPMEIPSLMMLGLISFCGVENKKGNNE